MTGEPAKKEVYFSDFKVLLEVKNEKHNLIVCHNLLRKWVLDNKSEH